ncbi:MAG: OPT/YSL family transporter [Deltaproteobacteria bacterium]|nr:OPT/YSL family transporter [Deltaproteobacteria bacterium]
MGSWKFHMLLGAIAILVLGPLGGITAAYMNFSLGFFVGGQVLAGILGSAVTFGYGAEGKHGANYMQTLAASVASMAGMAVLIQAMVWLGLEIPNPLELMLYYLCIGMYGVGVGMLFTPILVDKMRLTYPSGFAVANILRALTDKLLLKVSITKLAIGTGLGFVGAIGVEKAMFAPFTWLRELAFSASTFGAGMVVGVRIAFAGAVMALIGALMTDELRASGWLGPNDSFRIIGFVIALGMILGAAIVDLTLVGRDFVKHMKQKQVAADAAPVEEWKRVNTQRLLVWILFWGVAVFLCATQLFHQEAGYVLVALGLVFVFMLVNGISLGISDSNPISSAFVVTVLVLSVIGLSDAIGGLVCASILLISVSIGGDMQQDRSTGWRLGTNRILQFRYQVIGVTMGAVLAVAMANVFMTGFPELKVDQLTHGENERWTAAMTVKFVGGLDIFMGRPGEIAAGNDLSPKEQLALMTARGQELPKDKPKAVIAAASPEEKQQAKDLVLGAREKKKNIQFEALAIGISIGLVTEILRKLLKRSRRYKAFKEGSTAGKVTDLAVDCVLLPSPYASSFGGFVPYKTALWFAAGGIFASGLEAIQKYLQKRRGKSAVTDGVPEDMSTNSLIGGGLIAGESLAMLVIGIIGLIAVL